jgi:hypothetical protein
MNKNIQNSDHVSDPEKLKKVLGILIGFQFKDGRQDLLIPSAHSFDELQYYYDQVSTFDNKNGVKYLSFLELFKKVSDPSAIDVELNGCHLMLLSCTEEVNIVLMDEELEKIGCFMRLNEENPEASTIRFIDFDRWDELVNGKPGSTIDEGLSLHGSKNEPNKKVEE